MVFGGIVLALGAQQLADALYWRGQAAQAKHAIETELLEHEVDSFERLAVQPCLTGHLRALHTALERTRGEWRAMPMQTTQDAIASSAKLVGPNGYRAPSRLWPKEAWERAQATGALNHLPDSLVANYADIYTRSERARQEQDIERAAASRLSALAVDGSIDVASRITLLAAIAQIDGANSAIVNATSQSLDRLRLALRDVPKGKRREAFAERLRVQRAFRGGCVKDLAVRL